MFKTRAFEALQSDSFLRLTLTKPKRTVRKIATPKGVLYQLAERKGEQEFHTNFTLEALKEWISNAELFEGVLFTKEGDFHLNPQGKVKKTAPSLNASPPEHNRQKPHLLGEPAYFEKLKIQPHKKKQIERFLTEVKAILPRFEGKKSLTVADFGCGKAYLTFALYEFLKRSFEVRLIGIDLKEKVMQECQTLANALNYEGLSFITGSIKDFPDIELDLAVSLHACDTATDVALSRAVALKAQVILAAPCCHHECYTQIASPLFHPLLKHGILKERFASLLTDALRGSLLEQQGYKVDIIEFIEAEHTPKNLLIRAVFTGNRGDFEAYSALTRAMGLPEPSQALTPPP